MKINNQIIKDTESDRTYHVRKIQDFENENPIKHFSDLYISSSIWLDKIALSRAGFEFPNETIESQILNEAKQKLILKIRDLNSIDIEPFFSQLFEANSKKNQIKALKGLSLTSDELTLVIFKAFENYGFTLSQYKADYLQNGLDESLLPEIIHIDEKGDLTSIGETVLTKGQQKQVVEHRKAIVAKFLDNDKGWHCFFITYKSLGGKENYMGGQPHLHYISDKWGISREDVLKQLMAKDYSLPSLPHINFHSHRNPRE